MASSALSTKALFMRIVPAGGGKEFTVERWKKLPDTEEARKEYNAVEFSDDFYERHPDKKAVIYNRDLLDEDVMQENANAVADGGDYVKFKSDHHKQGLVDLNVMRGIIEKSRDPANQHPVVPSNPITREPLTRNDIALIMNEPIEEAPPHLVIARLFEEDIDDDFIEDNGLPPDVFSRIKNNGFQFSVTIPDGVTQIEEYAFRDCRGLLSVTIPETVTEIGFGAFYGCSGLTSVTIPEGVTQIGIAAFSDCSGLASVTIPEGVTLIKQEAFHRTGLIMVTIPEGVTIESRAFQDCRGLMSVTILEGVTIGDQAFAGCTGLILLNISEGVHIGDFAFAVCSGLSIVIIPKSVTMGVLPFSENTLVLTS